TSCPYPTATATTQQQPTGTGSPAAESSSGLTTATPLEVAIGVISAVVVLALVGVGVFFYRRRNTVSATARNNTKLQRGNGLSSGVNIEYHGHWKQPRYAQSDTIPLSTRDDKDYRKYYDNGDDNEELPPSLLPLYSQATNASVKDLSEAYTLRAK